MRACVRSDLGSGRGGEGYANRRVRPRGGRHINGGFKCPFV